METEKFIQSDPEHIFALRQLDKFMVDHRGFIAGGCFKNLFNNEHIKDVDIFFESLNDFSDAVNHLNDNENFSALYTSKNVHAYRHNPSNVIVELVSTIFGTPEEIINQFDFTIVKFAYYKELTKNENGEEVCEYKAVYHKQFFEHLHLKRLIIDDQIPKPISTFERMLKYRKYGYIPCVESKLKCINEIRKLPENEILVPTNFYEGFD